MEIIYGIGALALLAALIYGTTQYRSRSDPKRQRSEQIIRERRERGET